MVRAAVVVFMSLLAAPAVAEKLPWNAFDNDLPADYTDVTLGAGPHTLVILGQSPVQFSYSNGKACAEARKSIAKQMVVKPLVGGTVVLSNGTRAICVPR